MMNSFSKYTLLFVVSELLQNQTTKINQTLIKIKRELKAFTKLERSKYMFQVAKCKASYMNFLPFDKTESKCFLDVSLNAMVI